MGFDWVGHLNGLSRRLTQAMQNQAWQQVQGIDKEVRKALATLNDLRIDDATVRTARLNLKQAYANAIPVYRQVCEQMEETLINHNDRAEGRAAYLRTQLLQGES